MWITTQSNSNYKHEKTDTLSQKYLCTVHLTISFIVIITTLSHSPTILQKSHIHGTAFYTVVICSAYFRANPLFILSKGKTCIVRKAQWAVRRYVMLNGQKKFSRLVCPIEETETLNVQTREHQMRSLPHAKQMCPEFTHAWVYVLLRSSTQTHLLPWMTKSMRHFWAAWFLHETQNVMRIQNSDIPSAMILLWSVFLEHKTQKWMLKVFRAQPGGHSSFLQKHSSSSRCLGRGTSRLKSFLCLKTFVSVISYLSNPCPKHRTTSQGSGGEQKRRCPSC